MAAALYPKLAGFDLIQTAYKTIGEHALRVDIAAPTNSTGEHPVLIKYHGGSLMFGDSLYQDWWPQWLSDLALESNAVVISPNYRLMPESTSTEAWEDIEDFWTWLHSPKLEHLLAAQSTPINIDLNRVMTSGESAGGYLSLQVAMTHPDEIRSAIATYPWTDPENDYFNVAHPETPPFGQNVPEDVYQASLKNATNGPIVSSATDADRMLFSIGAIEYGDLGKFFARGDPADDLYPLKRLKNKHVKIPRGGLAIMQGRQDTIIPAVQTDKWVAKARKVFRGKPGGDKIRYAVRDGEHGFDVTAQYNDTWLQHTIHDAVHAWLE